MKLELRSGPDTDVEMTCIFFSWLFSKPHVLLI